MKNKKSLQQQSVGIFMYLPLTMIQLYCKLNKKSSESKRGNNMLYTKMIKKVIFDP